MFRTLCPAPIEHTAAATAAKLLQSCPTLCDPIDGSPPGSPVPGILQARTLEWVAISFSNAGKWKVKVKSLNRVRLLATPWTAAYQAPPSMGFSRQEYWSGVPLPSPIEHTPLSKNCNSCIKTLCGNWCCQFKNDHHPSVRASGQVTFYFFSLKEWHGLWAWPCDVLWLKGWSRSDGVSLDTRPQRSCLFPPTFNTSAFTVSIKPWWAHKCQEKKGRLEHRYRSIELHQTQNYPSHWDQLTLQSTWGCVNKLSWDPATSIHLNYTDAHAWFLTQWELTTANL